MKRTIEEAIKETNRELLHTRETWANRKKIKRLNLTLDILHAFLGESRIEGRKINEMKVISRMIEGFCELPLYKPRIES
jgi:hypothetical protein